MPRLPIRQQKPSPAEELPAVRLGQFPRPEKGTLEERRWMHNERRLLRQELRYKGINRLVEFESIARDLGLVLDGGRKARLLLYLRLGLTKLLSQLGMRSIILLSTVTLSGLFLLSSITEKAGSFTINLTADMLRAGFVLSSTQDFARNESRLFSSEVESVSNITVSDIAPDVDLVDGSHNGDNYLAYTFYIKNAGEKPASYAYYISKNTDTMKVGQATWVMLFEDGRQVIYAQVSADGDPEEVFGFRYPPFEDSAYDFKKYYYKEGDHYGLITAPFFNVKTVVQGLVKDIAVGEVHKYTVVLWIEGYDPDCTNEILGGYAKFSMDFENVSEKETAGIFDGVYRTEYADYVTAFGSSADGSPDTKSPP